MIFVFSKCLLFFSCKNPDPAETVAGYRVGDTLEKLIGFKEAESYNRGEVEDKCTQACRGDCPQPHKNVVGISLIFCMSSAGYNSTLNRILIACADSAD